MKTIIDIVVLIGCLIIGYNLGISKEHEKFFWNRGDKLELISDKKIYTNCDIIYIAGVATSESNDVFVLLKNCSDSKEKTFTYILKREDLRKIYND